MGTASQYTCLCNLGYGGTRCEIQTVASPGGFTTPSPFGTTVRSRIIEEGEKAGEGIEEQI
jgi:hypothetical protein